jgi:Na+/melibiose symporter-like transporter
MIYAIFFFGYFLVVLSIQASLPYVVIYVLGSAPEDIGMNITLIMAGLIVGSLISVPVWARLTKKLNNNKKAILIGSVVLIVASFTVALFVDLITIIIFTAFFGFAIGAFWYLDSIVLADVLDERSVRLKSDQKGATLGVREFISRLPRAVQVLIFAMVHTLTGFDVNPFNSTAQIGIRLHMTIIPAIIFIVFVVIFWKYYPLTTEKLVKIKSELKELGI